MSMEIPMRIRPLNLLSALLLLWLASPVPRLASAQALEPIAHTVTFASPEKDLAAMSPDGKALKMEQPAKNRWRIQTGGAATVVVSYKLLCKSGSVTTNWVGPD